MPGWETEFVEVLGSRRYAVVDELTVAQIDQSTYSGQAIGIIEAVEQLQEGQFPFPLDEVVDAGELDRLLRIDVHVRTAEDDGGLGMKLLDQPHGLNDVDQREGHRRNPDHIRIDTAQERGEVRVGHLRRLGIE